MDKEQGKRWLVALWRLLVVALVNAMVYFMLAAGGARAPF